MLIQTLFDVIINIYSGCFWFTEKALFVYPISRSTDEIKIFMKIDPFVFFLIFVLIYLYLWN